MKIEIEKPFIPQFVADWIEQLYGQGFDSDDLLEILFSRNYEVAELRIFDWFTNDKERAIVAILYRYEVEEEQKYYVLGKHDTPILFRDYRNRITETSNLNDIYPKANSEDFEFTEQEIKDYDERYIPFMVPVEEMEE